MNYLCLNDDMLPDDKPVLMADNKSFRYGDGLFETIKISNGKIILAAYHFERFFTGLQTMQFHIPPHLSREKLEKQILDLCERNGCNDLARIRLSAFRGNGAVNDGNNELHYIIECRAAGESINEFNKNGFAIDIYPAARKSCDSFSNLKSANYLPYVMAAAYARQHQLDDCLVLNIYDRIADASIANIFLVSDKKIITPPLSEGTVSGVMRRYLIKQLAAAGYNIAEKPLTENDIKQADEVFLTNSIYGIRWVKQFRDKEFACSLSKEIYDKFVKRLND